MDCCPDELEVSSSSSRLSRETIQKLRINCSEGLKTLQHSNHFFISPLRSINLPIHPSIYYFFTPVYTSLAMKNPNPAPQPIRILVINPNSSQSMTAALRAPIESLGYNNNSHNNVSVIFLFREIHPSIIPPPSPTITPPLPHHLPHTPKLPFHQPY